MAMDMQKVNELTENNKISKLIGMDDAGNLGCIHTGNLIHSLLEKNEVLKIRAREHSFGSISTGIASIYVAGKGTALFATIERNVVFFGDNSNFSNREEEGKICLCEIYGGNDWFEIHNLTDSDITVRLSQFGIAPLIG